MSLFNDSLLADQVFFNLVDIQPYGGSAQDIAPTQVEVRDQGRTLLLEGNTWKKIAFPHTFTANTILEFDFKSTALGEIHGIGFDGDDNINVSQTFRLSGVQNWGIDDFNTYQRPIGAWQHYEIPVGQFFTGTLPYLTFTNDHDLENPTANSYFSNLRVYEADTVSEAQVAISFLSEESDPGIFTFDLAAVQSYGPGKSEDKEPVQVEVQDNGSTLYLEGNTWKKIAFPYTFTPDTILEFDFKSTALGEIHGIGFDDDDQIDQSNTFKLYGTESWEIEDFASYQSSAGGWQHYKIPVGQFFTGTLSYLTFTNDHDLKDPTANSYFSNLRVYESIPLSAVADQVETDEDQEITILASALLANDVGDSLEIVSVGNAVNGSVERDSDGNVVFTPDTNFNGDASFDYVVTDTQGATATATVDVGVQAVNDSPVAVGDSGTTVEDQAVTFSPADLLRNDDDPDGDILQITAVENAINGSVVLDNDDNIVFVPAANFNGNASFDYVVADTQGATATATVDVGVQAVNDPPMAMADSGTTVEDQAVTFSEADLLRNDDDPDGDILQITAVENAINGSVVLDAQGNSIFTPSPGFTGDASFDYVVSDGRGGTATATVKVLVASSSALPDLEVTYQPSSLPALPTGTDAFAPSFVQDVAGSSTSPQIAEWTRTGDAGETLVLTGWQFSNLTGTEFGEDTKFWVYGQTDDTNGVLTEATLQALDGDIAAITLPDSLPEGSSLLVWAENSTGYSQPVMVNQTETWWMQEKAIRGQVASVFGRNLSQDGGTEVSQVYLEDTNGEGHWAEVVDVNPYKVDFKVPDGLVSGEYQVYVHNGDGGDYGWSEPLKMTVWDGLNHTGSVFNVKDFGAVGDGVTNDAPAIESAIRQAWKVPGSTVYFPTGTYAVHSPRDFAPEGWGINAGSNIRILGDGKDSTTIKVADGKGDRYIFQTGGSKNLTFQDLTLSANVANGTNPLLLLHLRGARNLHLDNVRLDAEGTKALDAHNSNGVFIQDSEIIGERVFLGTAEQVFIDGTDFYGTGYTDMLIHGFGVEKLSVTNSTAQNLDNSDPNNGKWVKGRFFTDQALWGVSQNQYFGNNQTIDLGPPRPTNDTYVDQNSGEQIMWEQPTVPTVHFGTVTTSTANTVSFDSNSQVNSNHFLSIIGGKGIGQSRQVEFFDSGTNTYQIEGSWNILPDESSIIVANQIMSKGVVYGNSLDGLFNYRENFTASAGVQTYWGAVDTIIDNNTFNELRQAVYLGSGWETTDTMPVHFAQVTNNTFTDSLTGVTYPRISGEEGTAILGSSVNKNRFSNVDRGIDMKINYYLENDIVPNANMNIFQNNIFSGVSEQLKVNVNGGIIQNNIWLQNDIFQNDSNLEVSSSDLSM